jgi:hypothetical protein
MRLLFVILLFAHGLIHPMGFGKAFNVGDLEQLKEDITRPAGVMWLLATGLYCAAGILFLLRSDSWWMAGVPALVLSQILIILSWSDAKFGTVANIIVLVPLVIAVMNALPSSFRNTYKREVTLGLERRPTRPVVREEDVRHLPLPVQAYLRGVGVIGKPGPQNFRATFVGQMQRDTSGGWMDIRAQQYDFFDDPKRVFYIESSMFGIPFDGLHLYAGPNATMQIRVGSLFQVVDARGAEMNKGETVTLFNDMCLLAPASLIDATIAWESVDSLTVRARFTNAGNTITALLFFNRVGELTDFSSEDRFQSLDGKTYQNYRWSTPVEAYKDFQGYRLASKAEAIWHPAGGDLVYAKFNLIELEYNCREFK